MRSKVEVKNRQKRSTLDKGVYILHGYILFKRQKGAK